MSTHRWAAWTVAIILALSGFSPVPAGAQEPPPELRPVRIVVLVDESGSLSEEDIARERDAVRVIVQGEPSPKSTVSVIGFASADASGQSPIDPVCPPTTVDTPQKHQALADCVGKLRRRAGNEGDGTDHVTALRAALSHLNTPGSAEERKIVYLLSDGKLDVSGSPAYGDNPEARNAAARGALPGLLAELNQAKVSVWPLGFGQADLTQLNALATGASQDRCGARTSPPSATVITTSADLLRAIGAASRSARCAGVSDPATGELPAGGTLDLPLTVPAIASEGAFVVHKRDPRVVVAYRDPQGRTAPSHGTFGESRFEISGQGTEAEVLRIVNPEPGDWTVSLSAPPGVRPHNVSAVAIFQGAVRAVIGVVPPAPQPGATAQVTMQVRGSRGAVTNPAQLKGLTFLAELTGEGFGAQPAVELTDQDGDGQYTGGVAVPGSASGRLDFFGSVTGIGVSGDRRPFPTRIALGAAGISGALTLDGVDTEVTAGDALPGQAQVTNSTGQPRTLRIEVAEPSPGAAISAEPSRVDVPAAGARTHDFALRFAPGTALGPNQARLRLVDEANGTVAGELLISRVVVAEPSWFEKLWWLWVTLTIALVALLVGFLWQRRKQRSGRDVRGVSVELTRHGQSLDTLRAQITGERFGFVLRDEPGLGMSLGHNGSGDRYTVRRGAGGLTLTGPAGDRLTLGPGGRHELRDGLELVLHDRSATRAEPQPPVAPRYDPYS
ncbi:vWA domain-containing protein [Crossiella cryophila]|uniref:VWFA domain-containing protein n=1 Tax=Crossiella cryophila TaxID=43355 RepID=A0A7W7CBD3_9PSEU|nr:vWA domain-containing protein [Crossiella cryophila]MBB4678025.1 hypothetical protein [Crossiella cryophila]